jgi:hypothetical protein
MDMEMVAAFGYGAKPYQWHNDEAGGLFQGTLNSMMKVPHPPLVICASSHPMQVSGKHTHSYLPRMHADTVCAFAAYSYVEDIQSQASLDANDIVLKKAALRGISVMGATGDSGAHCDTKHNTLAGHYNGFYPATSAYATGVGGSHARPTNLTNLQGSWFEDGAWGASSGGFFGSPSYGYATPTYQASAVHGYTTLDTADRPPSSLFNASARGVPDVSALSR